MNNPEISVIVRAHNEQDNLTHSLYSLKNQEGLLPSVFEVIVIDNASTDRTSEVAQNFLQDNPKFPGRLVYETRKGRGQALHRGVLESKANLVAFLDADSQAAINWLVSIIAYIKTNPNVIAGSGHIDFYKGPWHHRVLYPLLRGLIYTVAARFNQGWISGANWWVRKEAYFHSGGSGDFPEDILSDDKIMGIHLRNEGKVGYLRKAKVQTDNWLIEKQTWLTGLPNEFEQVRKATGNTKSFLHRLMEKVSPILSRWDRAKERARGSLPKTS